MIRAGGGARWIFGRWSPWLLPVAALALVATSVVIVAGWTPAESIPFVDWHAYALGTERVLSGASLYLDAQVSGPYHLPDVTPEGFIYPPSAALLFTPFAVGGGIGLTAWLVFNVALFGSGVIAVLRHELGSVRPMPLAAAIAVLAIPVEIPGVVVLTPFATGVVVANVNVALAGMLAWAWVLGDRRWMASAVGVAGAFKVFPGALSLWAARRHGARPVLVAVGVGGAVAVLTLPLVGLDEWGRYVAALSHAEPTCDGGRTSVACVTAPFLGPSLAKLLGVAIGGVLLVGSLVVRRPFPAFVLLAIGMLAPLADGHQHYLLFGYVLVLIGACRLWARRRAVRTADL